jgi:DNA-binding MarR family transcriptional regulator
MTDLKPLFNDLVRFETDLWNGIDQVIKGESGSSLGSLDVLRVVERTERCRVQDIARELAITVGGASQAVDRSTASGHTERIANPGDRRSSIVELTAAGRQVVATGLVIFERELQARLGNRLDAGETAQLAATLAKLRLPPAEV